MCRIFRKNHYVSNHGVERTETFSNEQNVAFYSDFCLENYMAQLFYLVWFFRGY